MWPITAEDKYLGHYITDDLSDDDDINRQRRTSFVQVNIILRKFNSYSANRGVSHADIYYTPALTAALAAMQAPVRQC